MTNPKNSFKGMQVPRELTAYFTPHTVDIAPTVLSDF